MRLLTFGASLAAIAFGAIALPASAQQAALPTFSELKPWDPSYAAPRTAWGAPNLQGVWSTASLTTLTQADVDAGMPFTMACELLRKEYHSRDRVWASFGDYDRTMFQEQCKQTGVIYPFGPRHLNVKTLFALARGLPAEIGMAGSLEMLGMPLEGTHHRGHDDAWNIAGILDQLLRAMRRP